MLLKKIRLGINPVAEDSRVQQVTARFDAAHDSVVRTPVLLPHAPVTPLPAVLGDKAPGTPLPDAGPIDESLHEGQGRSDPFRVPTFCNAKTSLNLTKRVLQPQLNCIRLVVTYKTLGWCKLTVLQEVTLILAVALTVTQVPVNMLPTQSRNLHT